MPRYLTHDEPPLGDLFAPVRRAVVVEAETAPEEPPPHPLLHEDGTPIGLGPYCELVTPLWRWDWPHLRRMDQVFDAVQRGELKYVILCVPPRHGKTEKATVRQAAYRLELDPTLRIILTAYNGKTARKFSRKIRRLVRSRLPLSPERTAAEDWETTREGGVRAAGVGEGIAGLPADLILVEDPIKSAEEADSQAYRDRVWEWYTEDVYTRLEPHGAIIVTMSRRHHDDLVGRILASEDGPNWTVINLPAEAEEDDPLGREIGEPLCPDRYDAKALARIKTVIGPRSYLSLYQQRPAPATGYIFKSTTFRYYTTRDHPIIENGVAVPYLPEVMHSYWQSWDMSFKDKKSSDFVDGGVWSRLGADCYLRHEEHERLDFPKTIERVRKISREWPEAARKLVEDAANGPAVIASLRHELQGLIAITPEGDKVSRAWSVTPLFEAGNVWFPHPQIAPWIERFILSLINFPFAAHDDEVDMLTQALRWAMKENETREALAAAHAQNAKLTEAAAIAHAQY